MKSLSIKNRIKKKIGIFKSNVKKWFIGILVSVKSVCFKKLATLKRITIFSFVDSCKLRTLLILFGILVGGCGVLYYKLSSFDSGIVPTYEDHSVASNQSKGSQVGILDAIYFSVITVSSLGYGDYRPVGYGRAVSSIEVLLGLMLFSIIVAKLASERQSAIIRLIYSSDVERRIRKFIGDIDTYCDELDVWKTVYLDHIEYVPKVEAIENFIGGVCNFLQFQVHEGMMLDIKSEMFLRRLFRSLNKFYAALMLLTRGTSTPIQTVKAIERIHKRVLGLAQNFKVWSNDETIVNLCDSIIKYSANYHHQRWRDRQLISTETLSARIEMELVSNVYQVGMEKEIALHLGISPGCVDRSLQYLMQNGRLLK